MYMQHNKLIYFYNIQKLSAAIREREREDSLVDQPKIIQFIHIQIILVFFIFKILWCVSVVDLFSKKEDS